MANLEKFQSMTLGSTDQDFSFVVNGTHIKISRSYADALKENPTNLTFSESLIVIEYSHIFEIF